MSKTYTAIYENPKDAEHAVEMLFAAGFGKDEISLLMSSSTRGGHFELKNKSKALQGVATGGLAGSAFGALVAALTSVGVVATGGVGLVAAGPAVAALAAAGAGAGAGGVIGGLIGLGMPEHDAKLVEDRLSRGDVLVAVTCDDAERAERARALLDGTHAATVNRG